MREEIKAKRIVLKTAGRFFYVEYVKKDGTIKRTTARLGVRRNITGEGLGYDPAKKSLMVIWDVKAHGYRMLNLRTILYLRCGDLVYDDRVNSE